MAAFFVTLYFLWKMYKHMYEKDNPLEVQLKDLFGVWEVEATSSNSGRKARSETKIAFKEGELQITGGTFYDWGNDGVKGKIIGSWDVEMAVSDGRKLKYFYTLDDRMAQPAIWKGVAELALEDQSLNGTWQVMGDRGFHTGAITMKKKSS